ncbi:MAG TPA: hypothetical protein VNH11_33095 [Pirellulales bacterium]|nr:hypothetical protein [Pirellulales bacterium]
MSTMADRSPRKTWLGAIAEAATLQRIELPAFDRYGMGAVRSTTTANGRFVTLKRRIGTAANTEGGVEWALWHQPDDYPVLVAAFRDRRQPAEESVGATLSLLKGWLVDQWTPDEAKGAVRKHPGAQPVKDPPPRLADAGSFAALKQVEDAGTMNGESEVFSRLFRYRPRPDRTPAEDFVTEAYASVLLSDKNAAAMVLKDLFQRSMTANFKLQTQQPVESDRPDMKFEDADNLVFQENKVESPFDAEQVARYQERIAKLAGGRKTLVVSCTWLPSDAATDAPHFLPIRWSDVYQAIKNHLADVDQSRRWFWSAFLAFLRERRMEPFSGIQVKWVDALRDVEQLRVRAWQLLELIKSHFESKYNVQTEDTGASKAYRSISKWCFSTGNLRFEPEIKLADEGVYFALWLRNDPSGCSAFVEAEKLLVPPFKIEYSHLAVRSTPEAILPDFYECTPDRQVAAALAWVDLMLQPLVQNGLLKLR